MLHDLNQYEKSANHRHYRPGTRRLAGGAGVSLQGRDLLHDSVGGLGLHWKEHVRMDPALFRPSDVMRSCGNASKAEKELGWTARYVFKEIVQLLVESNRRRTQ